MREFDIYIFYFIFQNDGGGTRVQKKREEMQREVRQFVQILQENKGR